MINLTAVGGREHYVFFSGCCVAKASDNPKLISLMD
jgi:hypothetical protein